MGNVTLSDYLTTYHIRVSAIVMVNGIPNEGDRSTLTHSSILFVPKPAGTKLNIKLLVQS